MRDELPAAMTMPPASTNFLMLASAVAPVPVPVFTSHRLRRSGSVDGAAAGSPAPAPPRPPPPPPRPPPPPPMLPSDGNTMTSYFDLRSVSSKPAPHTTLNGNSKRSSRKRVQPDDMDPVCVSHSATRF